MRSLALLIIHSLTCLLRLAGPGGYKSLVSENLMLKQQLLVVSRTRRRAPNLKTLDRLILGWLAMLMSPKRMAKSAVLIKPETIFRFHKALIERKYRRLFSSAGKGKPGPKGPTPELIKAVVAIKQRNPRFGCPRIAQTISYIFGIKINKDVVRRILQNHYRPDPEHGQGPSWLSLLGNMRDSLWSVDLFKCESTLLHSHWVLVVMDQCTRRIVGFGVHRGPVDGPSVCCMFNRATSGQVKPTYLSTDHDPLFKIHRWQANLRIMDIEEIKTVPYAPLSHPYIERLIGTIRREYLDRTLFWNTSDLERKLNAFKDYYNQYRVHASRGGHPPDDSGDVSGEKCAKLHNFIWKNHCNSLFQTPIPA